MHAAQGRTSSAEVGTAEPRSELSEWQSALQRDTAAFVRREVVPREGALRGDAVTWGAVQELRHLVRGVGVHGPQLPTRYGGLGLDWHSMALVFEEADASLLGPEAVLGEAALGFEYAQVRLALARLTHCTRWHGVARRSLESATDWAPASGGNARAESPAARWEASKE